MKTFTHVFLALTLIGSVPVTGAGVIADQKPASATSKPAALTGAVTPAIVAPLTINVDHRFTQRMADRAGLDKNDPQLSADGVRSGSVSIGKRVGSSECLIAETLIQDANQIDDAAVEMLCEMAASATEAEVESVKSALEEHAGTVIDDAIIHIVQWKNNSPSGTWYHYDRHAGVWTGTVIPFSKGDAVRPIDHLLGHTNVAFLAIHLGIDDSCKISYGIEAKHTVPLNTQDVTDLIKIAEEILTKGGTSKTASGENIQSLLANRPLPADEDKTKGIGVWGGETLLQLPNLPASIILTPKLNGSVRAGNKDAETWEVQQTCDGATNRAEKGNDKRGTAGLNAPKLKPVSRTGAIPVPEAPASNGALQDPGGNAGGGTKPSDPLSGLAATVKNEGLHWWDVSLAMPVTTYKNLKFDSQNNMIVTKTSNDIKPYALFDFFPGGTDLQTTNALAMLNLSAGLPIASHPLQKPFVGSGFTLAIKSFRLRPLVGLRIQKEQRTSLVPNGAGSPAQVSSNLHYEWHAKLQVMIGFSVADARKALGLK